MTIFWQRSVYNLMLNNWYWYFQKNKLPADNEEVQKLNNLMTTKDPFYKPPPTPEDQQSQR